MKKEAKNFALIGAAGYVAPKHMKAIKETESRRFVIRLTANNFIGYNEPIFWSTRIKDFV